MDISGQVQQIFIGIYLRTFISSLEKWTNPFMSLVKQKAKNAIIKLMKQVSNAYTTYFNKRHERVGPLFQGRYKGALIDSDEYLLHLTRYIHLNPLGRGASLDEFDWSSHLYYLY